MSDLYFNEESDYSEENTSGNEDFRTIILQPFQFEPEQEKTCVNESPEKETTEAVVRRPYRTPPVATSETKHIHASAADLLHIRIGNLYWNESHEEETKHIPVSTAHLLRIRIRNLDWCKCGHCKNEAREIDCLCCRVVDAMLIASAKIPECDGRISPSSF